MNNEIWSYKDWLRKKRRVSLFMVNLVILISIILINFLLFEFNSSINWFIIINFLLISIDIGFCFYVIIHYNNTITKQKTFEYVNYVNNEKLEKRRWKHKEENQLYEFYKKKYKVNEK